MNLETSLTTKHISEGLKKAREYSGISQKDTAALVGITTGALSSYEKGRLSPNLPVLESLSYIYHIPVHILISPDALEDFIYQPDADQLQQLIKIRHSIQTTLLQMAFEESGLSQKTLADSAGISRSKVRRYLDGDPIPVDDLKKITEALGIEFSQFIDKKSQVGLWQASQIAYERFAALPEKITQFLLENNNWDFIHTAYALRLLDLSELEEVIQSLSKLRDTMSQQN